MAWEDKYKTINPKTGQFWKKGDIRDDGFVFTTYQSRKNSEGFYTLHFQNPEVLEAQKNRVGTKRKNPDTNKLFQKGDKRPEGDKQDGKFFYRYTSTVKNNGYFTEFWVDDIDGRKKYDAAHKRNYNQTRIREMYSKNEKFLSKRKDNDGNEFVHGKIYDGKYFIKYILERARYTRPINKPTFFLEKWGTEEDIAKWKCYSKAATKDCECDFDYLWSIFPKDYKCPITGEKFTYTKNHAKSPSLDRINPKAGYVEGNVCWISMKMHRIKSDASVLELLRLAQYINTYTIIDNKQREEYIKKFKEGNTDIGERKL